jgi:hypothetical protein
MVPCRSVVEWFAGAFGGWIGGPPSGTRPSAAARVVGRTSEIPYGRAELSADQLPPPLPITMSDVRSAAPTSRLVALFAVSCGLLMLQVALTKVFSVVLWYHFGFLVISIALLGFATSGVWLAQRPQWLDERGAARLWRPAAIAAFAIVASLWLVVHTQVDAMYLVRDRNEGALFFLIGVLLVPFFFLGLAVSATLTVHRAEAGRVYAANLLGSGAGCGVAVVLFDALHLSATDVAIASGALVALGALLFALRVSLSGSVVSAAIVALFGVLAAFPQERADAFQLVPPESKPLARVVEWIEQNPPSIVRFKDGREVAIYGGYEPTENPDVMRSRDVRGGWVEANPEVDLVPQPPHGLARPADLDELSWREWTSLSRVDVFPWPHTYGPWGLWGLSKSYTGPQPRQVGITIDTWAMTNVLEWDRSAGPPPEVVEWLPAGLVHRLKSDHDVLCIGAGGGMDLLTAKRFGAKRIVGVEINPSVVKGVREVALDFQGRLYDWDGEGQVEIHVAEGRHWLERDKATYDVVQLSGVDTASTTQAGAFSLSENFLYTIEAFRTYLDKTNDGGFVTLTRWLVPDRFGNPRETLRLFVLAYDALADLGAVDPRQNIYLLESQGFSVIIFGRTPFTDEQVATLDAECARMGFNALHHPRRPTPYAHTDASGATIQANRFDEYAAAPDKAAWLAAFPYDVAAPTDDRPFFFETSRFDLDLFTSRDAFFNVLGGLTSHAILALLLLIAAAVSWLFVIGPLLRLRHQATTGRRVPLPAVLFYFGGLGLGFILVEVVMAQKFVLFLGNPLYSLAVVLFSVLVFSGIGSALSSRVKRPQVALGFVIALAAVYPLLLDPIFEAALPLSDPLRIAISVLLLAPLALFMGMPFALGLARLADADARATAWAWGVNGYTSVVGSILTVVISIAAGFTLVVWTGAAVYAVALVASFFLGKPRPAAPVDEEPSVPWRDPAAFADPVA